MGVALGLVGGLAVTVCFIFQDFITLDYQGVAAHPPPAIAQNLQGSLPMLRYALAPCAVDATFRTGIICPRRFESAQ